MWNHRVLVKEYSDEDGKQFEFGIHEVYYDDDGVPNMCTEEPVAVVGESLAGLGQTLDWMRACLLQPLLAYADFEEDGKYWTEDPFDISRAGKA